MKTISLTALLAIAAPLVTGCGKPASPAPSYSPEFQSHAPSLTYEEVLSKFRQRASTNEIQSFEELSKGSETGLSDRALELLLFKLTSDELLRVGITQNGTPPHLEWGLASSTRFADGGRAFENALGRVGIQPGGVLDLGIVGWSVPREKFFLARRAILDARLNTNEIQIAEPKFGPR